ncbi:MULTISPECIES: hypothetical protein [Streptomyces]|uniref:Uncharacterized protein n=1 Tax=Streptomyces rubrolavendulae TaxID=285473 RepID=A0A1D8G2H8_9ACTN|nr:hypothetical protein [Streptomyces rubrolavendulae]AOT59644.1 hypothetical protein A4G23_02487 [Streptomyces rubrolavendulae]
MEIAVIVGVGVILVCIIIGTTIALVTLARKAQSGDALSEQIRSIAGMFVVVTAVAALLTVAAWGVQASGKGTEQTVTVLTSAFTAVTSITTAYLGIRAASNTARRAIDRQNRGAEDGGNVDSGATRVPTSNPPH